MTPPADRDVRLEWIRCNACGADAFRAMAQIGPWQAGTCARCGLVYVNPMPWFQPDDFAPHTEQFYYTQWQHHLTDQKLRLAHRQMRRQLAAFELLAGARPELGRLLDIGCGFGLAVRAAVDEGWQATGLDIDARLVDLGRARLAVDLRPVDLLAACLPGQSYDFVRLVFVLEHLPNPRAVLEEIRRVLKPNGLVLVVVPNEAGLFNCVRKTLLEDRTQRLGTLIPPHHLHAYSPATLRRLFCAAGLAPRAMKTVAPHHPAYATLNQIEPDPAPAAPSATAAGRVLAKPLGAGFAQRAAIAALRGLRSAAAAAGLGSVLVAWARVASMPGAGQAKTNGAPFSLGQPSPELAPSPSQRAA